MVVVIAVVVVVVVVAVVGGGVGVGGRVGVGVGFSSQMYVSQLHCFTISYVSLISQSLQDYHQDGSRYIDYQG